jgi:hypothetical protein
MPAKAGIQRVFQWAADALVCPIMKFVGGRCPHLPSFSSLLYIQSVGQKSPTPAMKSQLMTPNRPKIRKINITSLVKNKMSQ